MTVGDARGVTVELIVDVGSVLAGPAVSSWFDGAVNGIARRLLAQLREREVEPAAAERRGPSTYRGPAGAMWADMEAPELGAVAYSAEHHRRFFDEIPGSDGSVNFSVGAADPIAGTFRSSPPSVAAGFIRHPWGPAWLLPAGDAAAVAGHRHRRRREGTPCHDRRRDRALCRCWQLGGDRFA
jgi:hypothetical protein